MVAFSCQLFILLFLVVLTGGLVVVPAMSYRGCSGCRRMLRRNVALLSVAILAAALSVSVLLLGRFGTALQHDDTIYTGLMAVQVAVITLLLMGYPASHIKSAFRWARCRDFHKDILMPEDPWLMTRKSICIYLLVLFILAVRVLLQHFCTTSACFTYCLSN
jgi:hypothetical protein